MAKIYYNNWLAKLILFKDYNTITIGCYILTKLDSLPRVVINEEMIHVRQWKDCFTLGAIVGLCLTFCLHYPASKWALLILLIPFVFYYILYFLEWMVSFIHHLFKKSSLKGSNKKAYYASAMEMEAKKWRHYDEYLSIRPFGAFFSYYGKL